MAHQVMVRPAMALQARLEQQFLKLLVNSLYKNVSIVHKVDQAVVAPVTKKNKQGKSKVLVKK
jgi:hypothetical protein